MYFLKKEEWIDILNHCGYTGDYHFTSAKTLNLKYEEKFKKNYINSY